MNKVVRLICWIMVGMADLLEDRKGATAIEYALIGAGFAAAILSSVFLMGNAIEDVLNGLGNAMQNVQNNTSS